MTDEDKKLVKIFMEGQNEAVGLTFSENVLAGLKAVISHVTPADALMASCVGCEAWNLTCPKCGEGKGTGKCGWETNCPVGLNPAYPSREPQPHSTSEKT